MPKKAAPKEARKRAKKPGKIADLPAKSMKDKDAAEVKAGGVLSGSLQTVETISTISRSAHDTAMTAISNLKA